MFEGLFLVAGSDLQLGIYVCEEEEFINKNIYFSLFNVTEQSYTTEDPVVWVWCGSQDNACDVSAVCAARLLVDGANVELWVLGCRGVDGKHMHHRQHCEQHLGCSLNQAAVPSIPASPIQEQPKNIHPLLLGNEQGVIRLSISYDGL